MNYSGNQACSPTFPFILVRGTNEYIFSIWIMSSREITDEFVKFYDAVND